MRIAYFVHDVQDAAVVRRTGLLRDEGLEVTVAGFRRRALLAGEPGRQGAVDLGLTRDGRLLRRVLSVLGHVLRPGRIAAVAAGADVLVARNLEMLVLARRVRRPGQRLVYECLDIHRLLLGMGPASRLLHRIEDWALQGTDLLVISAPAFLNSYFRARRGYRGAALLVENKVPAAEARLPAPA
ncbi:MAG TPA: hypothetical protein VFF98_04330, partial [Novosphingobium sp.]|nr:hypothetical protein [Novosphingobium sp.]